eukprot:8699306-Pyramimonas_sp.AAC.1
MALPLGGIPRIKGRERARKKRCSPHLTRSSDPSPDEKNSHHSLASNECLAPSPEPSDTTKNWNEVAGFSNGRAPEVNFGVFGYSGHRSIQCGTVSF